MVDDATMLKGLTLAGRALAQIDVTGLDTEVPSCPGWTVAELVRHTGTLHRWADKRLRTSLGREPAPRVDPPEGAALLDWFASGLDAVVTTLRGAELDGPCDTWAGERPRRWWLRRLAHETAIHAWDGTAAVGTPFTATPALAADALDEFFEVFLPRVEQTGGTGVTGTVHVHCTDVAGEWLLQLTPGGVAVRHEHAKGDVALRGPAWPLTLVLWRREPLDTVEALGDVDLASRLIEALRV